MYKKDNKERTYCCFDSIVYVQICRYTLSISFVCCGTIIMYLALGTGPRISCQLLACCCCIPFSAFSCLYDVWHFYAIKMMMIPYVNQKTLKFSICKSSSTQNAQQNILNLKNNLPYFEFCSLPKVNKCNELSGGCQINIRCPLPPHWPDIAWTFSVNKEKPTEQVRLRRLCTRCSRLVPKNDLLSVC